VKLKDILVEFGAMNVTDLAEVYPYMDLLQDIQSKVTAAEFKKFVNAFKLTKVLEGTVLPEAVAAIISSKPIGAFSNTRQTRSTGWLGGLFGKDGNNEKVPFAQTKYGKVQKQKTAESETKAVEQEVETQKKSKLIEALQHELATSASVDVAIVMDLTGSMTPFIAAARDSISTFFDSLDRRDPDIPLRVAFVGYRDHFAAEDRLAVMRFTNNVDSLRKMIAKQGAFGGGGDGPEDVLGGLKVAETLEWQAATRILYHIADEPAHGREFNDTNAGYFNQDTYPDGDPHGLQAIDILTSLRDQNVQYFFGESRVTLTR
jgi:hypothetical protein